MPDRRTKTSDRLAGPGPDAATTTTTGAPAVTDAGEPSTLRATFRRFWPAARPDRRRLAVAGLLTVLATACETAMIRLFGQITDTALGHGDLAAFWRPAAIWLVLAAGAGAAAAYGQYRQAQATHSTILRLRDRVFCHLQGMSDSFFAHRPAGDLVTRLSSDATEVGTMVSAGPVEALTGLVSVLLFGGAALFARWDLALVSFAAAGVLLVTARRFGRAATSAGAAERAAYGAVASAVDDNVSAMALAQSLGTESFERGRVHHRGLDWLRASLAEARIAALSSMVAGLIETAVVLAVLGIGTWEVAAGRLTVGGLLSFAAFVGYLFGPVHALGDLVVSAGSAAGSAARLAELLDTRPAVVDTPGARPLTQVYGELRFEDVRVRYPDTSRRAESRSALDRVSLTVPAGSFTVVTGPSGAGKSTLARLVPRLRDPDEGRVLLDGRDLRGLTLTSLRCAIAYVAQETVVTAGTVRAAIAYGSPGASDNRIVAAARATGLDDDIRMLPDGYDTQVGEGGARLSGGQRQRLAVARALVRNAPMLVLDEPTAHLDAATAATFLAALPVVAAGRTVILVTHDLRLAPRADQIVTVVGGRVVEVGPHRALIAAEGPYARLYAAAYPRPARPSRTIRTGVQNVAGEHRTHREASQRLHSGPSRQNKQRPPIW